jgi:hypothetical protein
MRETCKYISLLEWSSSVDFVEAVVVDGVADVGPELQGEEGNGAGIIICLQWTGKGIASIKGGSIATINLEHNFQKPAEKNNIFGS